MLGGGRALPKNIKTSFTYYPVHEKSPAWVDSKMGQYKGYPYPEGLLAYKDAERAALGYDSRPSSGAKLASLPAAVREKEEKSLLGGK